MIINDRYSVFSFVFFIDDGSEGIGRVRKELWRTTATQLLQMVHHDRRMLANRKST